MSRPSAWHLLLAPVALIAVVPLLVMVSSSFMTNAEISSFPPVFWPHHPTLAGYQRIFFDSDFPTWLRNTAIVSSCAVISQLVLCSLAGYAFARLRFRGSSLLQFLVASTIFIPQQLLMFGVYRIYDGLNLVDRLPSLILPWLSSAIGVFIMRQFFLQLPRELEEAALIDGASRLQTFTRVILPLTRPALAVVGLIALIWSWNDLLWPIISISSEQNYTLQYGLITFQGQHHTEYAALMAANVLVTLPLLVAFLLGQRAFVRSVVSSAVKG